MRRSVFVACLAASVLIVVAAPSVGAATLHRRILGQPEVRGAHARVPLLLDSGAEAVLAVPARSGFRTATRGRTAPDRTRLGDVVTAHVRSLRGGRGSAAYVRIDRRSAAPAFGDLAARLSASSAGARRAVDEVRRLASAGATTTVPDPGPLRLFLIQVRISLNLLIADLRDQAGGMSRVAADVKDLPRAGRLSGQLADAAGDARGAATKLEGGVTRLDEVINSIGGTGGGGGASVPVDAVGQVLAAALQVLGGLAPPAGVPGTPAVPNPLGGVPVPPVPPVVP